MVRRRVKRLSKGKEVEKNKFGERGGKRIRVITYPSHGPDSLHRAALRRAHDRLHLHALDDEQGLAALDLLPHGDVHAQYLAGHRTGDDLRRRPAGAHNIVVVGVAVAAGGGDDGEVTRAVRRADATPVLLSSWRVGKTGCVFSARRKGV